jgi:uncharacterized protein (TIGR03086 family)
MADELVNRAVATTASLVRSVRPEQYDAPTPCPDWTVRALLNHLIAGNRYFAAQIAGEPADPTVWGVDHVAGGDPAALYDEAAGGALKAVSIPGATERAATLPSGSPGPRYVDMYLMEQLLHGWDLATATGQDRSGDPAVVQAVYDAWYGRVPAEVRALGSVVGPEQPCPEDAPLFDRLAAYLGRQV